MRISVEGRKGKPYIRKKWSSDRCYNSRWTLIVLGKSVETENNFLVALGCEVIGFWGAGVAAE